MFMIKGRVATCTTFTVYIIHTYLLLFLNILVNFRKIQFYFSVTIKNSNHDRMIHLILWVPYCPPFPYHSLMVPPISPSVKIWRGNEKTTTREYNSTRIIICFVVVCFVWMLFLTSKRHTHFIENE